MNINGVIVELSAIFKTFGDDMRIRILGLLLERELCVCDIESVLEISQVNASRHLLKMKSAGILTSRKKARWVYYNISSIFRNSHSDLLESLRHELMKNKVYKKDIKTLKNLKKKLSDINC